LPFTLWPNHSLIKLSIQVQPGQNPRSVPLRFSFGQSSQPLYIEAYDAELERMTTSMAAENQSLQHDNKQLNSMIKEYEQTLENLMSAFRTRAVGFPRSRHEVESKSPLQRDVQEHELSLIREYEAQLLAREEEDATQDLASSTAISQSLARLSLSLRQFMRSIGGEDQIPEPSPHSSEEEQVDGTPNSDWSLERECELARLEKENEVLKRMLGVSNGPGGDGEPGQGVMQMQRASPSSTGGHGKTDSQCEEVGSLKHVSGV
jgi:hypothetical protein